MLADSLQLPIYCGGEGGRRCWGISGYVDDGLIADIAIINL